MLQKQKTPEHLCHYTDLDAVKSIFRSGELWLTDVRSLNDPTEYTFGRDYLKKGLYDATQKVIEQASGIRTGYEFTYVDAYFDHSVYIASFCTKPDLLSQWRGYCPLGSGYSIEFDSQAIADNVTRHSDCAFLVCNYDISIREAYLKELLLAFTKLSVLLMLSLRQDKAIKDVHLKLDQGLKQIIFSTLAFKHHTFVEESEVRLACMTDQRSVHHRNRREGSVPYIKIDFDVNTIKRVFVGPTEHPEAAKQELEKYLQSLVADESCALREVPEIVLSECPIRF